MEMKKKRAVLLSWMLIFTMVLGLFQGLSFVSEAAEVGYAEYTFNDVGLADGTYEAYTPKKLDVSTLNGVSFVGKVKFLTMSTGAGYGFCNAGSSTGFRYIYCDNAIIIEDYTNSGQTTYISAADLGLKDGTEIAGKDWTIRTNFLKRDGNMNVLVTVNDIVTKSLTFPLTKIEEYNYVFATGTSDVPVNIQSVDLTYDEYTFSDVSLTDGNYSVYTPKKLEISTLNGVSFVGKVKFSTMSTGAGYGFCNAGSSTGFRYIYCDNAIIIEDYTNSGQTTYISAADLGLKDGTEIAGKDWTIRTNFLKRDGNMNVLVTVNDIVTKSLTFPLTKIEEYNYVFATGTSDVPVNIQSVNLAREEYTFLDADLEDGNYKAFTPKKMNISSWNGISFVGTINFSEMNYSTGYGFCDANSVTAFCFIYWDDAIIVEDGTGSNQTKYISADALGLKDGTEIAGKDWTIRTTFMKRENNMKVFVTVNDVVTETFTFPLATLEAYKYVFAKGTDTIPANIKSVEKTYTDYTFSDVGISDGTYTSNHFADFTDYNRVCFTGEVKFSNGGEACGFGFVPGESNLSGLRFIIANGSDLYLQNYLVQGGVADRCFNYGELGFDSLEEMLSQPIKIQVAFVKGETNVDITITVNDTVTKSTYAPIEAMETCKKIVIQATETLPMTVASDGEADTPDVPEEPTVEAGFNSFGLEGRKIIRQDVSSTKVPNGKTNLDKVKFTGYVSFATKDQSDYILYGVNEKETGMKLFWSGEDFWIYDTTGKKENNCFEGISKSQIGVASTTDEVKIQVETTYTDTGVIVNLTVGNWNKAYEVPGYQEVLGTGILIHSGTGAISYRSSLGEAIDVNTKLETQGYKRITPADFKGLGYGTYVASESGYPTGAYEGAATLDMTYLDTDIQYNFPDEAEEEPAYFAYGFEGDWTAPQILYTNKDKVFGYGYTTLDFYITPAQFGMKTYSESFNIKIAMKIASDKKNYEIRIWVNDIELPAGTTTGNVTGNKMAIYTPGASSITFIAPEVKEIKQKPTSYNLRKYDHATAQNYFVSGDATVTQSGKKVEVVENQLDKPGDYVITTEVTRSAERYVQEVALYILGDVNLDGTAGISADVTALENMLKTSSRIIPTTAAEYAADIDNDGAVDKKDLKLLKEVEDNAEALKTMLAKYYVPAKTYNYLGGNDVMPIAGYFGPYTSNEKDYLTGDIFQIIKDSGVNMVNHTDNDAGGDASYTRKALALADQYGLGWFVDDYKLNEHQLADTLTNKTLSAELGKYSYFESFLGIHIVDEPSYDKATENPRPLENYTGISNKLNVFSNVTGFVNMAAEDARTVNEYGDWVTTYRKNDYYDEYWNQYMLNGNPQVISSDDYPFNNGLEEDAEDASGYFRTLGKTRNVALDKNVPFWSYVQAGGNFDNDTDTTTENLIANEAETYWNVNTALAFGAKGIVWFPLIQPTNFDGTDPSNPIDRNGVILSNGKESGRYTWVQKANKQIAAVDDVLMKSTSTAIVASGGYAKSQAAGNISMLGGKDTTTVKKSHGKLTAVSTNCAEYGALVGCFNYRDTEAFYVVNYDVTAQAEITLTFDQAYHVRVVQNGESKCGNMTDKTMKLTIGAGQGALVVLENNDDAQCYYKTVKASDGTISYQCVHTKGNTGEVQFGTILYGDLNGNGKVDAADIVRMKKAMAEKATTNYPGMGDLNGDYKIESVDCDLLRDYLVGETKKIDSLLNEEGQI